MSYNYTPIKSDRNKLSIQKIDKLFSIYPKGFYPDSLSIEVILSGGTKNAGKNLRHYRTVNFHELQPYFH